jgi:Tol biopolymer transport system component
LSPDGSWLAYVSDESGEDEVYVLPTKGDGARITISSDGGTEPVWGSDASRRFYRSGDHLKAASFDANSGSLGTPEDVLRDRPGLLRSPQGNPNYDVSPDGRRFLMVQQADSAGPVDLQLVLNWDAELKACVPVR